MCLGEVAQVVALGPDSSAVVRSRQRTATVSLLTLDEPVAPGDWVVCHSGFALGRVTAEEATEATAIRATTAAPATTPAPTVPPRKDPP
ncbi:MAG TPA: HypC/HybG/HupF family hydrogenase formation chaperone [Ornithinibacter sp.]|nr:HypC/HybG/HupF family hydrogenase formation chaperone [Ornithinibacter sp.]